MTIHPDDRNFCGLSWDFGEGPVSLVDQCISFGQRSAPFIFSRITDFVSRNMRRRGFNCLSYLDDFFLVEHSKEKCTLAMNTLMQLLRRLGFHIAFKKLLPPSQTCRFLGIILDSVCMEAKLPDDKLEKIKHELDFFSGKKRATLKQIQRLAGTLCHASKVIYGGRPFSHHVIELLKSFKPGVNRIRLPPEFHKDLEWWSMCAASFNGKTPTLSFRPTLLDPLIPTVSETGFLITNGAFNMCGEFFSGSMGYDIRKNPSSSRLECDVEISYRYDMPTLRLLSVLAATIEMGNTWSNNNIFLISKYKNLVHSLRKGRAESSIGSDIIRNIYWLSVIHDFRLIPFYI